MKYVSLFSGIEAATVAWEQLGWEPMCFAEFDEFPSAVLAERYPEVPNVGDVTKMNWKKYRNKVDLVVGGSRASPSRLRANERGCKVNQGSCSSTFERYVKYVLDGFFGKTSRERSQARMGRLSDNSCPKWTNSGTVWRGAYSMRSSSEWPKGAAVSFLSDILEPNPPQRFSLSRKACEGVIRRAEKRGKPLPPQLDEALRAQASNSTEGQEPGI